MAIFDPSRPLTAKSKTPGMFSVYSVVGLKYLIVLVTHLKEPVTHPLTDPLSLAFTNFNLSVNCEL